MISKWSSSIWNLLKSSCCAAIQERIKNEQNVSDHTWIKQGEFTDIGYIPIILELEILLNLVPKIIKNIVDNKYPLIT